MYPFLAQPPPKQRRLPPPPLTPASSRAHPYANISAWASSVQPGSPAPCSPPHRRSSTSSRRRSFVVPQPQRTPSTATGEYPIDLSAVGYTSLFIHFDKTPTTPSPFKARTVGAATPLSSDVFGSIPIPPVPPLPNSTAKPAKRVGLSRFRSILRGSKKQPPSPLKSPKSARKRDKYPSKNASANTLPPPSLANQLALMQFIEGGTIDDNVNRLMHENAGQNGVGVAGVYRDAKGGIWYDADEEMEYAHLLGPQEDQGEWEETVPEDDFVVVIGPVVQAASPKTNAYCPATNRPSPTSIRTRSSSSSNTSPVSPRIFKHALLSIPSRPRRNLRRPSLTKAYPHLANTPTYLIDIDAFAPRSPAPKTARPPSSSNLSKKHRPRPAPLQLSSSQSAHARANAKVALGALNGKGGKPAASSSSPPPPLKSALMASVQVTGLSPASLDRARKEFVDDSFQP